MMWLLRPAVSVDAGDGADDDAGDDARARSRRRADLVARSPRRSRDETRRELLTRGTEDHYQDAELYDFEYRDRDEDIEWYRTFASEHAGDAPILEIGAGSGRVTVPLAADGHQVVALDRMETMLERLQAKLEPEPDLAGRVRVIQGDMTELPLRPSSVSLVLAPFNVLMHLYTWDDLLTCFRQVHRALVPGGRFALDVQLPDLEWLTWDPEIRHAVTYFRHPRTGERLVYSTNHTYDPSTQVCHIRIFYDDAPPRGRRFPAKNPPENTRVLVNLAHRQIFPEELRGLVHSAGFSLERLEGDFGGGPLRTGCESQVLVCRKPPS
jgi:SAM-dependent methyltransferase